MAQPGAAGAQAQAAHLAALGAHDKIRRSSELPLFYGNRTRDTISAMNLVDRLENAANIAKWDTDERKCEEFYTILRDNALTWWYSLKHHQNLNKKNWTQVKAAFLRVYEPKYSPKITCTNLADLYQAPGEKVHDFYLRLIAICRKLFEARPARLFDVVTDYPKAPAAGAYDDNIMKKAVAEGLTKDENFVQLQLFLAGMKEELRVKVIESGKDDLVECMLIAVDLEQILARKSKIAAAIALEWEDPIIQQTFTLEEQEEIAALRAHKAYHRSKSGNNRTPPKANSATVCRYCKKSRHFQKDCRSRIQDKAPMVDANGKPFAKRINPIGEDEEEPREEANQNVGSISGPALNWF